MVGVFVFEISGARLALVFFPNLFEFYFLLIAGLERFKPDLQLTGLQNARWLVLLLIPKLAQEYVLHYARWLDRWVALEIIEDVIDFVLRRK